MENKRLMILDGNSLIYRAFHALPPLMTKEGIYTNGVYGFLTMFYKVLDEYKPDYICVAFDPKTPTFRHKEFDEYKAGRAATPDELRSQFPILKEVLDKMGVYRIEVDGFEADDVVGTLAKFGEEKGFDIIVVSGDKDYLQLASEKIKILITKKGITNLEIYDKNAVIERYELTPEQFIDLKGLMGDKSDNIPGVPGIGEKTGIKLLKEFKSIEGIYENIDKVSGSKLKEKLIENKQQAFLSKRLAQIITNIPIDIEVEELKQETPNIKELYELYKKLEFKSLYNKIDLKEDDEENSTVSSEKLEIDLQFISDSKEVANVIEEIKNTDKVILKFLIDGIHPLKDKVLGLGIKCSKDKTYYVDFSEDGEKIEDVLEQLKEIFENEKVKKLGHNLKNEVLILLRYGISLEGIHFDSMIGQYLINPSQNNYSLKNLADDYLNIRIDSEEDILGTGKKKRSFSEVPLDERGKFLGRQINVIFEVEKFIKEIIESQDMIKLFYEVEIPLIEVLANMEYTGFKVDMLKLKELGEKFDNKINLLTSLIYEMAGQEFNINSPKQLGEILFEKLNLPVIKKTKTGYSTDAEVLEKLKDKHPIIEKILEYRQIVKLKTTYIDGLMTVIDKQSGKVHSSFNQTITTTGRISSTEPNLQNIPIKTEEGKEIRKVFIAQSEEYTLVDADYSQIELRVLAHISDDEKLKDAFYREEDIHLKTAAEVFGVSKDKVTSLMRSRAKAVNFGIIYGISDYGLARDLNISRKESKEYIESYLEKYKKVKEYMERVIKEGKEEGYVETILKRRRYLPELGSKNFNVRSFGERLAMNTPIQGSAADIIKVAMVNVYKELKKRKMKSKLILQVHDELIVEAHKDEVEDVKKMLKDLMENAILLNVPLRVEIKTGDSWYDTK